MISLIESLRSSEVKADKNIFNSFSERKAAISDLVDIMMVPLYEPHSVYKGFE